MLACSPRTPLVARASRPRFRPAFTLLEVLVVVAILLILAGLGTFAALSQLEKARVNEANLKMAAVEGAVKRYMIQNDGNSPDTLQTLITPPDGLPFLEGGMTAITDPWGKQFQMKQVADQVSGAMRVVIFTTDNKGTYMQWPKQ